VFAVVAVEGGFIGDGGFVGAAGKGVVEDGAGDGGVGEVADVLPAEGDGGAGSGVGAASSLWKAPSWGNRRARGVRIARNRFVGSDSPETWKTLAPCRAGRLDHTARKTHFPHFTQAHLESGRFPTGFGRPTPDPMMPAKKTNAVTEVTVLHTKSLTLLTIPVGCLG